MVQMAEPLKIPKITCQCLLVSNVINCNDISSVCTLCQSEFFTPWPSYHLSPQRIENEHLLNFLVWQRMREQPLGPSESPHLLALLIVKQSGTLRLKCDVRIQGAFLQTAHISTVSLLSVTGPGASTTTL